MERFAVGFAPGHISGYFKRVDGLSIQTTGSLGAGVVIDKGVYVKMSPSKELNVKINGETVDSWLIREVLEPFGKNADVEVTAEMPIGSGFGMSAAGLLASYFAADAVFDLGLSKNDMFLKAHAIEVKHGTGLGDVTAISCGEIVVRTKPGIHGILKKFYDDRDIYCLSFGEIPTNEVISSPEKMKKVEEAFPQSVPSNADEFMKNSLEFARNSGLLLSELEEIIQACESENIPCSMTMLGKGVFAFGEKAKEILEKFGEPVKLRINSTGPCVVKMKR
ncbi:MAG: GHMP kinase [Methanocorpusculum sp.]|nr:GHMP kinase [Methanocorpusculum sp.]